MAEETIAVVTQTRETNPASQPETFYLLYNHHLSLPPHSFFVPLV